MIGQSVLIVNFLYMSSPPVNCHLVLLTPYCLSQEYILEKFQLVSPQIYINYLIYSATVQCAVDTVI
jgi:hypothetical protein